MPKEKITRDKSPAPHPGTLETEANESTVQRDFHSALQRVKLKAGVPLRPTGARVLQRTIGNRATHRFCQTKRVVDVSQENKGHAGGLRTAAVQPSPDKPGIQRSRENTCSGFRFDITQGSGAVRIVQRANALDPRLPLDKKEALAHAASSNTEIQNVLTNLSSSADHRKKNIPTYVTTQKLKLDVLTPRHDSTVKAKKINFFQGQVDYTDSLIRVDTLPYSVSPDRKSIFIRARSHTNVDNLLSAVDIGERVVQSVSELSHTVASTHAVSPTTFEIYRGRFNGYWDSWEYVFYDTQWNPGLDSRGPQSDRARYIFERIYQEEPDFAAAYDGNKAGMQERVNSYMGPDTLNRLNSVRVQALRAAFHPYPTPITGTAQYNTFKGDIQTASAALQPEERQAISDSNEWRRLIAIHCNSQVRRDEIRDIITTLPATPPAVAPPSPPPVAPPAVSGSKAQKFLDGVTIDGPTGNIMAINRTETVKLTPKSPIPNPGVTVDTKFTVDPGNRVKGSNISAPKAWPFNSKTGVPFDVEVYNTGDITMNAKLGLINNPTGLTPATPPTRSFTIKDDRLNHFKKNWEPFLNFTKAGEFEFYDIAVPPVVRYVSNTQRFIAWTELKSGYTNPGLSLYMKIGIHRGAKKLKETTDAFGHDKNYSPEYRVGISAPATVPPAGDTLTFKFDLLESDRKTVINNKTVNMVVKKEQTYKKAQAIAAATADQAWMRGTAAGELLDLLTKKGGMYKKLSDAIRPPNPLITVKSFIRRPDSAAYVKKAKRSATQVAYFEGITYGPHPDPNTSIDSPGLPAYARQYKLFLNKTTNVATGATRSVSDLIENAIHEGTHTVDDWTSRDPIPEYKSEFRAYWNEGRYGPPDKPICFGAPGCFHTTYDPNLKPPGPQSPRARKIFEHLYASYSWVKPAYDANEKGFREVVDHYYYPEGLNLIFSRGLDALQKVIRSYLPATFNSVHTQVKGFMGIGAPPPKGPLNADDKTEIKSNRAWVNLLNDEIGNKTHRSTIRAELKIP